MSRRMWMMGVLALLSSERAFAAEWHRVAGVEFHTGRIDFVDSPLEVFEVARGAAFRLVFQPGCGQPQVYHSSFLDADGATIPAERDTSASGSPTWRVRSGRTYELSRFGLDIIVMTAYCVVDLEVDTASEVPAADDPSEAEAQVIADALWDEQGASLEQSTPLLAGGKWTVFLRFIGLRRYRDFLDRCRELGTDPDARILNVSARRRVRVELVHSVTNG